MTDTPTEREAGSPWGQLRRRKVVQWGLAYAAAAWTLLQVVQYLSETYSWPPAVRQLATPALAFGLLIALVLAWYHGERGDQRVSRAEAVLILALVAVAGGTLWWYGSRLDESSWVADSGLPNIKHVVPIDAASVAVLPFVDMSQAHDQEYFADGLSEEILNALARIPGLYVPARTSSFQFKGQSGDVAKFAAMLGVRTVLEGSVRRSGDHVRVTASLVNAANGYHVWSQTYDRELKDIFEIQDEIGTAIAGALKVRLSGGEGQTSAQAPPTSNLEAYEAYLLGRYELAKVQGSSIARSIEQFQKAIALDSRFADAYADLAVALMLEKGHANATYVGEREFQDHLNAVVVPVLAKAQAIAPDWPEVLAAAGRIANVSGDPARALGLLDRALAQSPNVGDWLTRRSMILEKLGQYGRMLAASSDAVRRDPLSPSALNNHVLVLLAFGRRDEVEPFMIRLTAVAELSAHGIATVVASYDGDHPTAVREYLTNFDLLTTREGGVGFGWRRALALQLARLGMREEVLNLLPPMYAKDVLGEFSEALPGLRASYRENGADGVELANALYGAGQFKEAAAVYRDLFATTNRYPYARALLNAADAERRSGDPRVAREYRDRAARLLASADAAGVIPRAIAFDVAMLHAYDGQVAEAAASLILAMDSWNTWLWFYHPQLRNPLTADLFQRPDVKSALHKYESVISRQRAQVVRMLCGPSPVSKSYKPSPATCAKRSTGQ